MELTKAELREIGDGPGTAPKPDGEPIVVQINPATLRLQMSASTDAGKDSGRSKVQYQGSTSTLSFDLMFDTADEGTSEDPVDVRTRTRSLERFVLPAMKTSKAVPPRVQFTYGSFTVIGVMTSLNQDFDYFARNGVPLRAKCAVTIKEQRPEFDATKAGAGANTGSGATPAGATPAGAGSAAAGSPPGVPPPVQPAPPPDRSAAALAGESAPDLAARLGLDPAAWKGLQGITDPLNLPAGKRVDFSSALTAQGGLGAAPPTGPPADGAALATAGGLTKVLADAAASGAGTAAETARQGFVPGPDPARSASPSITVAVPGSASGPDPRALSYGYGVPLRPRLPACPAAACGLVTDRRRVPGADGPPSTDDPTVAGWLALPTGPAGDRGCGCAGAS
jgi:contractile injection system tube protein